MTNEQRRLLKLEFKSTTAAEDELLTVDEVHAWLRLGRTRLNELLRTGELPSYKLGRRRVVRRGDVMEWLDHNRYQPGE
jgi:excisionase family DNA binding protein